MSKGKRRTLAPKAAAVLCACTLFATSSCGDSRDSFVSTSTNNNGSSGSATATVGDVLSVPIQNQYIVVLNAVGPLGATYEESLALVQQVLDTILIDIPLLESQPLFIYGNSITGFAIRMTPDQAAAMALRPEVAYVEQDKTLGYDPALGDFLRNLLGNNPGGNNPGGNNPGGNNPSTQQTPWGIQRVGSRASSGRAWVIDTGIDLDHPDLSVDVSNSRSFVGGDANDGNGHGTHVAGTIAALDNNIGVVGVAAGARVVAIKVLDGQGQGTVSGVIAGVDYTTARAVPREVANLSLSGGTSQALDDAVKQLGAKGVGVSMAAGNSSQSATNFSPARANGPNLYTVSAFDRNDRFASFSNFGNPPIDFSEPGVDIRSTSLNGGYANLSGTSMAAPHLAGILLNGTPRQDGTVTNDPDGNADRIGVTP